MSASSCLPSSERLLAALLVIAAWACYGPLGSKYAAVIGSLLCAAWIVRQRHEADRWRQLPGVAPAVALLAWLAITSAWSPAPWRVIGSHLWGYALLLAVPLIATACPPAAARRALQHFVLASVAVATLFALSRAGALPASTQAWHTTIDAEGNQRIATSILLAMGGCLAAWFGGQTTAVRRWAWWAAAALCVVGVALQDRRTGMLLLPALLLAWALVRQPSWWRRLAVTLVIGATGLAAWQVSDGVRGRFAEGLTELRLYKADDTVATSWGQRLRMWEVTATMVHERPLAGHGIASWRGLWQQRVTPGTALAANSTPHNEYLLLAQQGGAIAVGLWLWLLATSLRSAARKGAAGVPALMAWTALAWVGLFNAVLRDAKFALPLLLLAAVATALGRESTVDQPAADLPARCL